MAPLVPTAVVMMADTVAVLATSVDILDNRPYVMVAGS